MKTCTCSRVWKQCCRHREHAWRQALSLIHVALSGRGIRAVLIHHTQALASDRALCVGMPGQHQEGNAHIPAARTRPHFQPQFPRPIRSADQASFTLLLSHTCPLSQKGIHSCQGAWQTQLSRLPMLTKQEGFISPWAPTAMLRGSAVTSSHNHFLPS